MRYLVFIIALFAALQTNAQNNIVYGAGINYTNGAPTFTPPVRTSRVAIDTVTGKWYHFNTPGGWQLIGNTIEEIAGCTAPAYTPGKGDSKVVINNCSPQPELYFYNGSAWVLVGGGSVYAGEGIRIENDTIILDSLYVLRFRTGDTTDLNAGAVSWNAGEQTLDVVINQGAVTGQMFQEVLYFTKNQTGAQINDGTVVMAAGTTGNSGKILIAPAIADGSVNSEYILGLATQNIPNGGEGMVTHFGKVRGIQTNGANYGETWVDGDVLYCSAATPGYLTKVLPTAPNLKIPIAIVIHAHPSNGTLFVRPSHFPDLAQINDVELSSPTNGQVLTYNSTLSRWENATPANQLQTLSTDNTPGNISISSGNTITLNVNDADASATNELQTLSVAANTATLSNSGGSVTIAGAGINTVGTAGTTITVTGTEVDGSTTNELQTLSTGTNTLTLSNGGGTVTVDTDPSTDITGSGTATQIPYFTGAQTVTSESALQWDAVNDRLGIGTIPSNKLQIQTNIDGPDGIFVRNSSTGTLSNTFFTAVNDLNRGMQLFAYGSNHSVFPNAVNLFTNSNDVSQLNFIARNHRIGFWTNVTERMRILATGEVGINQTAPAARLHVVGSGTSSSTWTAQFHNSAGNNNALMIRDDGNVGIGTSSPGARLQITPSADQSAVSVTGYSITGANNQSALDIAGTWNTTAAPSAIRANITNTASSSQSLLINLQIGSVTRFSVRNDGVVFFGPSAAATSSIRATTDGTVQCNSGLGNIAGDEYIFTNGNIGTSKAHTSGTVNAIRTNIGFSPTSGTGLFNGYIYNGTINQTGGSSGITRGFYSNPTLASIADWRSFEFSNTTGWGLYGAGTAKSYFAGNVAIGTTTQNASAAFEVASTTQGVLFPRMTTAQRDLIATPANGLVIYNSTTDKLQVRAGGAWVDLH